MCPHTVPKDQGYVVKEVPPVFDELKTCWTYQKPKYGMTSMACLSFVSVSCLLPSPFFEAAIKSKTSLEGVAHRVSLHCSIVNLLGLTKCEGCEGVKPELRFGEPALAACFFCSSVSGFLVYCSLTMIRTFFGLQSGTRVENFCCNRDRKKRKRGSGSRY